MRMALVGALRETCKMAVLGHQAQIPALSNTSGCFGGSDDSSNALAATQQRAVLTGLRMGVGSFSLGLTSPALASMTDGLGMAQLVLLNGMNGMNPSGGVNMNMLGMANLSAMDITWRRSC